jgi:triosephosphate isomerase
MKKLIIANWKMQLTYSAGLNLAKKFVTGLKDKKNEIVICPEYLALSKVAEILKSSGLKLGAQDSAISDRGAYTGEVSPANLKTLGVKYIILGHSERREHLHENSAIISAKIKAALAHKMIPVLCVGEKLIEKENGSTRQYLAEELQHALKDVKIQNAADLVIAYEPVWAISTNKNARPMVATEAEEIQKFLKAQTAKILKKKVRVLYGGSVNAVNAAEFLRQPNIDGFIVGGASLNLKEFRKIC